ncbi:MAG: GGDEF domain-containing protein [Xenococcaceae cyanobacterium]
MSQINVKYGHQTGDLILHRVGNILQSAFVGAEVLGYWGYGEFAIGIPELNKQQSCDVAIAWLKFS